MKLTELRNQGTGSLAEDLGLTDEALRRRSFLGSSNS